MSDWYTDGVAALKAELVEASGASAEQVDTIYAFLSDMGMIDYDIEKELVYARYNGEEEE